MNYGVVIFLGVFLTFASAWLGLVFAPSVQLKDVQSQVVEGTTELNPRPYSAQEQAGRQVYQAEGCVYCHTQQLRGGQHQSDTQRFGGRRSHPRDYIYDRPLLLGTMRTGPDLINIGSRQPSVQWHLSHLYNPQKVSPGSIMAPYRFLFEMRPIVGEPSVDALKFDSTWTLADGAPPPGQQLVATDRAKALVAYLKSLDRTYEIQPPAGGKP